MTPPAHPPSRIILDHTHLRGAITGLERVAVELFAPERVTPHAVRTVHSRSLPRMILAQQIGLPLRGLADSSALCVFPGFPPGPLALLLRERCLIYVHDTFLVTRRAELNWRARVYMAPSFALAVRFGTRFFVNSRATGEALRALCRPDALVALLRPPVRDVFGLAGPGGPAAQGAGASDPGTSLRMLAIGTIEPRKGYAASIALVRALRDTGIRAELHLVGRQGWGRHDFLDAPPPYLHLHGYLDAPGLRALVRTCHLLLSTSKAEGLGLPLLEAQHGGLPVVAPEGEVFAEVLGNSALFIQPDDPQRSARAIRNWIADGGLEAAPARSRANITRWNELADGDAERFRRFLSYGPTAYAGSADAVVAPSRRAPD